MSNFHPPPTLSHHFRELHLNVIFHYPSQSLKQSLPKRFPHHNTVIVSCLPIHATYQLHPFLLEIINCKERGLSCRLDSRSAGPESSCRLCNPRVHCRVYNKTLPLKPALSLVNSVYILTPILLKIHFNIVKFTPRSLKRALTFGFSEKTYEFISHACYMS